MYKRPRSELDLIIPSCPFHSMRIGSILSQGHVFVTGFLLIQNFVHVVLSNSSVSKLLEKLLGF